jgi:hypothetical protein
MMKHLFIAFVVCVLSACAVPHGEVDRGFQADIVIEHEGQKNFLTLTWRCVHELNWPGRWERTWNRQGDLVLRALDRNQAYFYYPPNWCDEGTNEIPTIDLYWIADAKPIQRIDRYKIRLDVIKSIDPNKVTNQRTIRANEIDVFLKTNRNKFVAMSFVSYDAKVWGKSPVLRKNLLELKDIAIAPYGALGYARFPGKHENWSIQLAEAPSSIWFALYQGKWRHPETAQANIKRYFYAEGWSIDSSGGSVRSEPVIYKDREVAVHVITELFDPSRQEVIRLYAEPMANFWWKEKIP